MTMARWNCGTWAAAVVSTVLVSTTSNRGMPDAQKVASKKVAAVTGGDAQGSSAPPSVDATTIRKTLIAFRRRSNGAEHDWVGPSRSSLAR